MLRRLHPKVQAVEGISSTHVVSYTFLYLDFRRDLGHLPGHEGETASSTAAVETPLCQPKGTLLSRDVYQDACNTEF